VTVAVVLRWPDTGACRVAVETVRPNGVPLAYRALLAALWAARRVRARRLVIEADDPAVAAVSAQVAGGAEVPRGAAIALLQIRALLNAFDEVRLRCVPSGENDAVFAASAARVARVPAYRDLPLWAAS
jgi:hypothetical protein